MTMNCSIRQTGDVTILDLSGRLSLAEAVAFGQGSGVVLGEMVRDLTKKGQIKVLLNLARINYVDSSGVGQLVGALTTLRNHGGELKLLNPTSLVRELLKATRLDTIFDVKDDEATAIQSFARKAAAPR